MPEPVSYVPVLHTAHCFDCTTPGPVWYVPDSVNCRVLGNAHPVWYFPKSQRIHLTEAYIPDPVWLEPESHKTQDNYENFLSQSDMSQNYTPCIALRLPDKSQSETYQHGIKSNQGGQKYPILFDIFQFFTSNHTLSSSFTFELLLRNDTVDYELLWLN